MEKTKKDFWKYALARSKQAQHPVILKDVFLKWAADNSFTVSRAQDIWKEIQAAITFVDNGVLYQVDDPSEIKEIRDINNSPDFTEEELPEESDISKEMKDAIEEKKEEKQEEEGPTQRTLLDSLEDEEDEEELPETLAPPPSGMAELPEEPPPLPTGAV